MKNFDFKKHPFTITLCALMLIMLILLCTCGIQYKFSGFNPAPELYVKLSEVLFGFSYSGHVFANFSLPLFIAYFLPICSLAAFIVCKIKLNDNIYLKAVCAAVFFVSAALFVLTPSLISVTEYGISINEIAIVKAGVGAVITAFLSLISGIICLVDLAVFKKTN